ncbi:hypothetical protein [Lysobacter sp. TAB13]|uniref:hypothetical protein n=1 Tax=Lysobacter sp. TAB13 TaxID=3233065 RepID=UPI003F961589
MSTIRNSSSNHESAKRTEAAQEASKTQRQDGPRQPPAAETVDQFRSLMQQRQALGQKPGLDGQVGGEAEGEGQQSLLKDLVGDKGQARRGDEREASADETRNQAATDQARQQVAERKNRDETRHTVGFDRPDNNQQPTSEASAMWQAQLAMRADNAAPAAPMQPNSNAAAFADLIERHVRQLAVSDGGAGGEKGQVLLRLSDQTLPGTDLLLTKTAEGWQLRADSRSRSSYDAIREAGPELMRRFASRNLGQLSIDPHFHD